MALVQTTVQEEVTLVHGVPRVVWGAIVAGALMVMAIELGLALLGAGIGLSLTSPASEADQVGTLAVSAVIWWFSSSLVAMYVGSWIAGHFARNHGRLHGLLMWGTKAVLTFVFLAVSVGVVSAGAFALLDPKAPTIYVKQTAQKVADSNLVSDQRHAELMANAAAARSADTKDMTPEEAKIAAEKAAKRAAQASLLAFFMLALGAGVSGLGGAHGARDASREIAIV